MTTTLHSQLIGLLGNDSVIAQERVVEFTVDGVAPQAVVQPADRQAVAATLRWALSQDLSVIPRGGGTQLSLGNIPHRVDLVLDLSRMNRVLDFQPADLTVTVEAGITLDALQSELARESKLVQLEGPIADKATIGGILAANTSGPLRASFGLPRDSLIGICVVSAAGVETKAGGKVVKNVTGYDLNKLYSGSLGTLGIIVEASFKLTPLPATSGALVAEFPVVEAALQAAGNLKSQVYAPQGIHVLNDVIACKLGVDPVPNNSSERPGVIVAFISGQGGGVRRRMEESIRLFQSYGATQITEKPQMEGQSLLQRFTGLGWADGTQANLSLKISLPPSNALEMMEALLEKQVGSHVPGVAVDAGFGGLQCFWWLENTGYLQKNEGIIGETDHANAVATIKRIRDHAAKLGGSVVVERCPLGVKQQIDVWGDSFDGMAIMRRIKQQFDPQGILNPGRFVGRL